ARSTRIASVTALLQSVSSGQHARITLRYVPTDRLGILVMTRKPEISWSVSIKLSAVCGSLPSTVENLCQVCPSYFARVRYELLRISRVRSYFVPSIAEIVNPPTQ